MALEWFYETRATGNLSLALCAILNFKLDWFDDKVLNCFSKHISTFIILLHQQWYKLNQFVHIWRDLVGSVHKNIICVARLFGLDQYWKLWNSSEEILPLVGSLTFLKYMLLYFLSPDSVQHNFSVYKCNLSVCMDVIPASFNFWTSQTFDCQNIWFTLQLIHAKNCPFKL